MSRPESQPSLRPNYLSRLENVAQSLGVMAPTGTLGVIIPLLIGKAGNGTWLVLLLIMVAYGLILLCINQFAGRCVSAGSLATYAKLGLGRCRRNYHRLGLCDRNDVWACQFRAIGWLLS
jgi:amino acid transporter